MSRIAWSEGVTQLRDGLARIRALFFDEGQRKIPAALYASLQHLVYGMALGGASDQLYKLWGADIDTHLQERVLPALRRDAHEPRVLVAATLRTLQLHRDYAACMARVFAHIERTYVPLVGVRPLLESGMNAFRMLVLDALLPVLRTAASAEIDALLLGDAAELERAPALEDTRAVVEILRAVSSARFHAIAVEFVAPVLVDGAERRASAARLLLPSASNGAVERAEAGAAHLERELRVVRAVLDASGVAQQEPDIAERAVRDVRARVARALGMPGLAVAAPTGDVVAAGSGAAALGEAGVAPFAVEALEPLEPLAPAP